MTNKFLATILPLAAATLSFGQQIHTTLNGNPVNFSGVHPISVDGRVLVPVRGIFEQMGVNVDWNPDTRSVFAAGHNHEVVLYIDSRNAKVDNNDVQLDVPAQIYGGSTMVPLRFISESMGARVRWNPDTETVAIMTESYIARNGGDTSGYREQPIVTNPNPPVIHHRDHPAYHEVVLAANTVIPVRLNEELSSRDSEVGQQFTATLDTANGNGYMGLPAGTIIVGHVSAVRAKTQDAPGVLGLAFDRMKLPGGQVLDIDGSLTGLDDKSVTNDNGRIVSTKSDNRNTKYVGIGAGAGALLAVVTKGNVITTTVIGAALGYLYDQQQATNRRNVTLKTGTTFGVVLNQDETFRVR